MESFILHDPFREAGYCGYPVGTAFSKAFGATIHAANGYDEMPETKIGGMGTSPEDYMEMWQLIIVLSQHVDEL